MRTWVPARVVVIKEAQKDGCVLEHMEEGGPGMTWVMAIERCEQWLIGAKKWHDEGYVHEEVATA